MSLFGFETGVGEGRRVIWDRKICGIVFTFYSEVSHLRLNLIESVGNLGGGEREELYPVHSTRVKENNSTIPSLNIRTEKGPRPHGLCFGYKDGQSRGKLQKYTIKGVMSAWSVGECFLAQWTPCMVFCHNSVLQSLHRLKTFSH